MRHLLAVALVAMTTLVAVPATAAEGEDDKPVGRLMLVLDSSGSMSELTGDGRTRIDAAKDALRAVVNQLPDEQPVGMRVFGATQPTRAGAELYCSDSQNVATVATDNRDALNAAIDAYEPYGETPIAFALQATPTARPLTHELMATMVEALGDDLIVRVMAESGLPRMRLEGERGRTTGQLRLFASVLRDGGSITLTLSKDDAAL